MKINLLKRNIWMPVLAVITAVGGTFATTHSLRGSLNPEAYQEGQCNTAQEINQPACPGGDFFCSIGSSTDPVYPTPLDCQNNTNVMKWGN